MAAGPWIWGEEWGRSGSGSTMTFVVLYRSWGVPLQEMNTTEFVISENIHQRARLAQ